MVSRIGMYSWNARAARAAMMVVLLDIFLGDQFGARVHGLARPPVVEHLVIVPLRKDRDFGVEGAEVLVEQIVFVGAAELGEGLGGFGFLLRDDALPDLPVRHFLFGLDRAVGVDVVAVMDEEIGPVLLHGGVGAHAAARLVDAPALARGIARPDKADGAAVGRRGAEA